MPLNQFGTNQVASNSDAPYPWARPNPILFEIPPIVARQKIICSDSASYVVNLTLQSEKAEETPANFTIVPKAQVKDLYHAVLVTPSGWQRAKVVQVWGTNLHVESPTGKCHPPCHAGKAVEQNPQGKAVLLTFRKPRVCKIQGGK